MNDGSESVRPGESAEKPAKAPLLSDSMVSYLLIGLILLLALSVFLTAYLSVPAMSVKDYEKASVVIQPVGYSVASSAEGTEEAVPASSADFVLNLNTASAEELDQLPGIGEVTAKRIVSYRQLHGAFTQLSELMNVKGIGQTTYDEIKAYLTLENLPSNEASASEESDTSESEPVFPIDINTASVSELTLIPGIGEATAESILEYREQIERFDSLEQLLEIKGIGDEKLADFREYLTVGSEEQDGSESSEDPSDGDNN